MYHAYNLLGIDNCSLTVAHLYPMLEGQVAALSSGALTANEVCEVLKALFQSDIYRKDQDTFMLYPDRELPRFLDKNKVPSKAVEQNPLLSAMVRLQDHRIIRQDDSGAYRFHPELINAGVLSTALNLLCDDYGDIAVSTRDDIGQIYERVFNHKAFTGRSGGMFGFEGLGCIYWHMVSKLLLAVQEQFFAAKTAQADSAVIQTLGGYYYAIRQGIGFNKTPEEYGAFPCDPYSHTPKHAGAQQPGMTGQVKEEVLTRFGELGIRVEKGQLMIEPSLLRGQEFCETPRVFNYLDVNNQWQKIDVVAGSLVFTWCQVPFVYHISELEDIEVSVFQSNGEGVSTRNGKMSVEHSQMLFDRAGDIIRVDVQVPKGQLFCAN